MKRLMLIAAALLLPGLAAAQMTVTMTPSVTAGDGTLVTDMSWSTNPALPTGTPCTAGSTPTHPSWTGAKAGSGTVTGLTFTQNTRLTLSCVFQGDSIVTYTWVNPTLNTDGTPYTNPKLVRIKHTFDTVAVRSNAQLSGAQCGAPSPTVVCTDVPQTPAPQSMRTVTGISQTGTLRATALAVNMNDAFSDASNFATKQFTGNVTVNQGVDLTIRSIPNTVTGFGAQ